MITWTRSRSVLFSLVCLLVGLDAAADATDAMFDRNRVIDVRISIPTDDWDRLRAQERTLVSLFRGQCLAQPFPNPFTWFSATVTIDGQTRVNAGVRKKGFLGSLDAMKPALKIDLDEFQENAAVHGLKKLTLNNAKQDPALVRQCLGYKLFKKAGLPAPRCNFAHVSVNDKDLGVYVNVEEIRKPMLARHFPSNQGNLYEGTVSDFHPVLVNTFEAQTNEQTNDRSDLQRVIAALGADDANLPAVLGSVVDMERFRTFWAMEGLLGFWDGYSSNRNNFYLYAEPLSGKFHFIPWGTDGILSEGSPIAALNPAANSSMFAYSALTRRLVDQPGAMAAYAQRSYALLASVWNEGDIHAEINHMQTLLTPHAGDLSAALAPVRAFVDGRRSRVMQDVSGPAPAFPPLSILDYCLAPSGSISAGFVATWGTHGTTGPFTSGAAAASATFNGLSKITTLGGADAGLSRSDPNPHRAHLNLYLQFTDGKKAAIQNVADAARFFTGARLPVNGQDVNGSITFLDGVTPGGLLDEGTLHLNVASTLSGGRLCGKLEAKWQGRLSR